MTCSVGSVIQNPSTYHYKTSCFACDREEAIRNDSYSISGDIGILNVFSTHNAVYTGTPSMYRFGIYCSLSTRHYNFESGPRNLSSLKSFYRRPYSHKEYLCKVLMRILKHEAKVVARWCKNYRLRSSVICTLHLMRSVFLYLKYCHRNILQCLRFCFRVILAHVRLTHRIRTSCTS